MPSVRLLATDIATVAILSAVEVARFLLGQMTVVLGFVGTRALGDIGVARFVPGRLLSVHRTVGDTIADALATQIRRFHPALSGR